MATVSTFNIALIASTSRFVSNMARAERRWNQFAKSVQRQAKVLPQALREAVPASLALGRNVVKWTAVATAALGGLSVAGVKLAADFEQSQIAFETMLGDAGRARRFLRELEVYARRTPFGFTGLQQSARQLLAYGFTADRVLEMITPIGDTVAAMGGGQRMLEAIIRALGQIQAKGKLASQEFLQLTEQGVAAWQMLAEFLGVSVPEAMDLASRGAISSAVAIEAVLQGMTRRFAGAMTRQATTIAGRWEQIKDSVTTIVRAWGQDVVHITGLAAAMGVLADAIERVADAVSLHGFLGALERAFPPWVAPVIIGIAGAIVGGLVPAILAWLIPALKKLAISLWATLKPLTPWMAVGAAVALTAYVLARNWGNLAEVGQRVWTVLGGVALYGASLVVRGSALIYQALSWIVPALRGTAESVMAYANSLRDSALQAIQSATASARVAQQAAESASTAEQAAQAQESLAAGLEAAQQAAKGGVQSFDEVHQVQESLLDSFELPEFQPLDVALPELDATASMVDGLAALEGVITSISDAAAQAWDRLTQSIEPVRQAIEWLRREWPGLGTVIENTASVLSVVLVSALVAVGAKWAWLGAEALIHAAKVAAAWVVAMGPVGWVTATVAAVVVAVIAYWDEIKAATERIWGAITSWLVGVWASISSVASAVWGAITGAIASAWGAIRTGAETVWTALTGWLVSSWDGIVAAATSAWTALTGAISTAWEGISSATVAVWDGITSGLRAAWDAVSSAATTTWQAVRGAIEAVWSWASETVGIVWGGIRSAIEAVWTWASHTAGAVWDGVRAAVVAAWEGLGAAAQTTWSAIQKVVADAWSRIIQSIGGAVGAIKKMVQELHDKVTGWFVSLRDSTVGRAQEIYENVVGFFQNMYQKVVGGSIIPDMVRESLGWFDQLKTQGISLTQDLAGGVTGMVDSLGATVRSSFAHTFEQVISGAMSFSEGIKSIFTNLVDAVKKKLIDMFADKLVQSAISLFTGGFGGGGGILGGIIGSVTKGIGGLLKGIGSIFGLASGGIVTAPTLALMGEGYRREAVIPLERDNVIAESVGAAVFDAMMTAHRFQQASGPGPAGDDREIVLKIDGTTFARLILPHLKREGERQGLDVALRPAMGV